MKRRGIQRTAIKFGMKLMMKKKLLSSLHQIYKEMYTVNLIEKPNSNLKNSHSNELNLFALSKSKYLRMNFFVFFIKCEVERIKYFNIYIFA